MQVRILAQAEADLEDIWYFIARDNLDAATRTIDTILARVRVLASFPTAGRERDELYPGLRSWPINNYVVFYTTDRYEVRIGRILHGRRDVQQVFHEKEYSPLMAPALNLPQYRLRKVDEFEHDYHIHTDISAKSAPCPQCGSMNVQRWGARTILVRDLPMHGKRVTMHVRVRRLRCQCRRTFQERLPGVAERRFMTQRLFHWIEQQSLNRPFLAIAHEVGVDEGTIRNIHSICGNAER